MLPLHSMAVSISSKDEIEKKEEAAERKMALQQERRSETGNCGIAAGQLQGRSVYKVGKHSLFHQLDHYQKY